VRESLPERTQQVFDWTDLRIRCRLVVDRFGPRRLMMAGIVMAGTALID